MKFDPEERHQYVGASEVGALFGACPWKTLYALWHEQYGDLEPEDISRRDAVFWGTVLQPAIAEGFARLYPAIVGAFYEQRRQSQQAVK